MYTVILVILVDELFTYNVCACVDVRMHMCVCVGVCACMNG